MLERPISRQALRRELVLPRLQPLRFHVEVAQRDPFRPARQQPAEQTEVLKRQRRARARG